MRQIIFLLLCVWVVADGRADDAMTAGKAHSQVEDVPPDKAVKVALDVLAAWQWMHAAWMSESESGQGTSK